MNDGKGGKKLYNKKAEYELIISGRDNCEQYINEIGFIQNWKPQIGRIWLANHKGSNNSEPKKYSEIKSIEYLNKQETFCLTEPNNNEVVVAGICIGNCGELALSHADSCCLGSMVLSKYVRNSFEKNASFDFVAFDHDVRLGVRFLDNIISLEKTPLPEQQWANDNGRRLGLGFMGLADMLMRMRIKFDSDHAIELVEKVSQQLMTSSYDASCDLAQEKGAFPVFDYSTHMNSEFIKKLPRQILERIKKTGLRNIGLNAIAPTGTISCVAQCSSSLEPVFALKYTRRTNLGTAKEVKEYEVFPAVVQEYMHKFDCKFENLPDFFIGAHSIHPKYRIKLQATVQKYIDQSISNTVNLPMDCKEEDIAYYYFEAWKQGIKGITVYREGSREGVLLTEKKHETGEIQIHQSPRRPDVLDSVVHIIKPNGRTFTVFVGLLNGRVFEVFALDHKVAALTDGMQGKIIKHAGADGMNTYCFESGAVMVQKLNKFEDDEMSLLTRLISTSLRHGTPIEFIVDQICKSKITIKSPGKAIAHALSKYMKQEEIQGKFKCPKCNSSNMKFEGLCKTCLDCNWSRCG
jgi:ribonucleoside-diphosphate reductase alpha chain